MILILIVILFYIISKIYYPIEFLTIINNDNNIINNDDNKIKYLSIHNGSIYNKLYNTNRQILK